MDPYEPYEDEWGYADVGGDFGMGGFMDWAENDPYGPYWGDDGQVNFDQQNPTERFEVTAPHLIDPPWDGEIQWPDLMVPDELPPPYDPNPEPFFWEETPVEPLGPMTPMSPMPTFRMPVARFTPPNARQPGSGGSGSSRPPSAQVPQQQPPQQPRPLPFNPITNRPVSPLARQPFPSYYGGVYPTTPRGVTTPGGTPAQRAAQAAQAAKKDNSTLWLIIAAAVGVYFVM